MKRASYTYLCLILNDGWPEEVAEHLLCVPGEGAELSRDVGEGAVGDPLQLVGDRELERAAAYRHRHNHTLGQRHSAHSNKDNNKIT